jgi:hypothetical protein
MPDTCNTPVTKPPGASAGETVAVMRMVEVTVRVTARKLLVSTAANDPFTPVTPVGGVTAQAPGHISEMLTAAPASTALPKRSVTLMAMVLVWVPSV